MGEIKNFTDLNVWIEGHSLVLDIYRLTRDFPIEEKFGLTIQLRRCVVSITSNIAEGFSRQSNKEKIQFYSMAGGSLSELQNQLLIARDINYLNKNDFEVLAQKTILVSKLLNGLIRSIKNR